MIPFDLSLAKIDSSLEARSDRALSLQRGDHLINYSHNKDTEHWSTEFRAK